MANILDVLMQSLGLKRRAPAVREFVIDITSGNFDPGNGDHAFYEQMVYEEAGIELDTSWRVHTYSVFDAKNPAEDGEYPKNCQMVVLPDSQRIISIEVEDSIDFDKAVGLLEFLTEQDDWDFLADSEECAGLDDLLTLRPERLDEVITGLDVIIAALQARLAAEENAGDRYEDYPDEEGWDEDEDYPAGESDDLELEWEDEDTTDEGDDEPDLEKGDDQS